MGLFSGKSDKNDKGKKKDNKTDNADKSGKQAEPYENVPRGASGTPPQPDSKAKEGASGSSASRRTKKGGRSAARGNRGSERGGLERGAVPPTGGTTVATIGKSIIIKGDLSGDEDLIIEGKVEGRVQLPNNEITVGADGRITADIEAKAIIVVGQTAGNLNATQRVEVQATGTVDGDIAAPRLQIQEGATVNGSISMTKTPASANVGETKVGDSKPATPIAEPARKSA
ncbi:MAG: polymer-forming cytoskeletal protein [bacterium]|nr:polymer-forming cytoskeletal protein [bacterium]